MWSRNAQVAAAVLILLAVVAGCFQQLLRHPADILVGPQRGGSNDLTSYFIASRNFPRLCCDKFGQWPLWNPFSSAGTPYVGNPQAALYYPPNWLCWWLDARDVLSWMLVAHHLFAGLGTYLLCRRYGFEWSSALVGGACFLASPYLIAQTGEGHYAQIGAVSWMPWAFLCYEELRGGSRVGKTPHPDPLPQGERETESHNLPPAPLGGEGRGEGWTTQTLSCIPLAIVLAMSFFAGHAQETYYLVAILSAWRLVDAITRWIAGARKESGRLLLNWMMLGIGVAALVAIDLIPIQIFSRQAIRSGGLNSSDAGAISLQWINLIQLLNPLALGGPSTYAGSDKLFWETVFSFGIVPLELAIFGVVSAWRRYPVQRLAWFWLFAVAFAMGTHGPVFSLLYQIVPGLSLFRVPSRILYFGSLAIAVLAAAGTNALLEVRPPAPSRSELFVWRMLLAGALAGMAAELYGWFDSVSKAQSILALAVSRTLGRRTTWAWVLAGLTVILAARRWPTRAHMVVASLLVLVAIELGLYANRMLSILPASALRMTNPASNFVRTKEPYRVLARQDLLNDATAWEHSIQRAQGYDPLPLARTVKFFSALSGKTDATSEVQGFSSLNLATYDEHLLDLLNVRYAVLANFPAGSSGLIPLGQGDVHMPQIDGRSEPSVRHYFLCENPNVLPRAFVVGQSKVALGLDPIQTLAKLRPREEALMESEYLPPGPRAEFAPAHMVEYTPNRVIIEADLPAAGYLVLSDTWYPGWTASDNGRATSVLLANLTFRAVTLSPGKHRVEFQFRPPGLLLGASISGGTWSVLLVSLIVLSRKSRVT